MSPRRGYTHRGLLTAFSRLLVFVVIIVVVVVVLARDGRRALGVLLGHIGLQDLNLFAQVVLLILVEGDNLVQLLVQQVDKDLVCSLGPGAGPARDEPRTFVGRFEVLGCSFVVGVLLFELKDDFLQRRVPGGVLWP